MAGTISKDTPLTEITLRRYEKPYDLPKRELVRKLCLSAGLLQPGDSRDVIVDVLCVLLEAKRQKQGLSSDEIRELVIRLRRKQNMPLVGVASSNIRRQLKRLRDIFLVQKVKNNYVISEFADLAEIFDEKLLKFLLPSIVARVQEYFKAIDEKFKN
ncbi:MAG: hypothetical protein ABH879_00045 [archaeon]